MFTIKTTSHLIEKSEALVIGLYHENKNHQPAFGKLNDALNEELEQYIKDGDISNDYKQISKIFTLGKTEVKRLYFVGLGRKKELTASKLKNAFGNLFKNIQNDMITEVSIELASFTTSSISDEQASYLLSEAMGTSQYEFPNYKTSQKSSKKLTERVTILTDSEEGVIKKGLNNGYAYAHGVNTARHLVQLPGNLLTASDLAEYALSLGDEHGFEVEILDKEEMERLGMGALLAVNQGSTEPPKMIVLKYQGRDAWDNVLGLVGKGITFDTGGYSIKSKTGIVGMKTDMGGAAAVLGAMDVIGRLKPKKNVVAVIPSTDNMISGSAFKPDDIITSLNGKTIEVLNTDAEGRLALADGLSYAKHHKAERLIDVATLTGGIVTALGDCTTGAMTNNDSFYGELVKASEQAGEAIWLLPYNEQYRDRVRSSELADINNSPSRKAHPIMAGAFLAEFAEETPWIHLDIAGTAVSEGSYDLGPKGPTGVMVRTLAHFILTEQ